MDSDIAMKYCWLCGEENKKRAKKCENCGSTDSLVEITEEQKEEILEQMQTQKFATLDTEVF